jgi:hypothetical protein
MYAGFWWGNLRERDNSKYPGVDGRMILEIQKMAWGEAWTGWIWLRIGTGGGLL